VGPSDKPPVIAPLMASKDIKGFNKVLNSFRVLDIESDALDISWDAVMLAYDGPGVDVLNM